MKKLLLPAMIAIFLSCNDTVRENPSPANKDVSKTEQAEILLDSVIAGHDVAMPLMKKLERLTKETKAKSDSVAKLAGSANAAYKAQLDSVYHDLNHANGLMMKWMDEFVYDSLENNEPERLKYLKNELEKVNTMKAAVLNSLQKAESFAR